MFKRKCYGRLLEWKRTSNGKTALPGAVHSKVMRAFDEYMLVGGMPQSVEAFLQTADFGPCDRAKRSILELYLEDIGKFGGSDARRARAVFRGPTARCRSTTSAPVTASAQARRWCCTPSS